MIAVGVDLTASLWPIRRSDFNCTEDGEVRSVGRFALGCKLNEEVVGDSHAGKLSDDRGIVFGRHVKAL